MGVKLSFFVSNLGMGAQPWLSRNTRTAGIPGDVGSKGTLCKPQHVPGPLLLSFKLINDIGNTSIFSVGRFWWTQQVAA
jgi:hypothetical protein